jgi:AhpD family alkylhydroperoxidase
MTTAHELQHELQAAGRKLREAIPGVYHGYAAMSAAAMGEGGALPAKMRELIALAIAVTRECDGCVVAHARGAAGRGATAQEVAEAMGVAIAMNGGPGTVWGPRAYAAFQEFAGKEGMPETS